MLEKAGSWEMYNVLFYVRNGKNPVLEYIESKPENVIGKIQAYINILRERGTFLGMPYVKKVEGKIFELRVEYAGNQHRLFYFFWTGRNIVFVHAVDKKTQRLDRKDIEISKKRMKELTGC